jgi:hypothetical protein
MAAPRVGIGVFVFKRDGTFILGKRKGSLGSGESPDHLRHSLLLRHLSSSWIQMLIW